MKLIFLLFLLFFTQPSWSEQVVLCDAANGLDLINREYVALEQIQMILNSCDKVSPNDPSVLLLHALLAKKNAHFETAIAWLEKARAYAPLNQSITLELANLYEYTKQVPKAQELYQSIIAINPSNRAALLGQARIFRMEGKNTQATLIYQRLLAQDSDDVDALNGLGWLDTTHNNLIGAKDYFNQTLLIQPQNTEALNALNSITQTELQKNAALQALQHQQKIQEQSLIPAVIPSFCEAELGLILLQQKQPALGEIKKILIKCDKNTPNTTTTLLLHGLLARYLGQPTKQYDEAITWLIKAAQSAPRGDNTPLLELAVTYEWAGAFKDALVLYDVLLNQNPWNKSALLGKARVLRFSYQIKPSLAIYQQLQQYFPNDIDVLRGMGEDYLANYDYEQAKEIFAQILVLDATDEQTQTDVRLLNESTRNILDVNLGRYNVGPRVSEGFNLNYFRNLDITDSFFLLATHNTKQIESGFGAGTALLPNNSLLFGYQRLIPQQYGWQLSFDTRQHNNLPLENRVYGFTNLFLQKDVEWFGSVRIAFPERWTTQLFSSGLNVYTSLPVDVSITGFWAFQEIGCFNSSYSLDFSKGYNTHLFYNLGSSYLVEQRSWELHGRLIYPIFKNQSLTLQGSHYFFNNSTFVNVGWRWYWA